MLRKVYFCLILLFWPLGLYLTRAQFSFPGHSVFQYDYQAEQQILRDTKLYDSIFLARVSHNKARIPLSKITHNFFSLVDPNNYFFGSHPEELIGHLNIQKFPFFSIFFFFAGLYFFKSLPYKKVILAVLVISIMYLSVLLSFDGIDIILWIPISLIILHGVLNIKLRKSYEYIVFSMCIIFACIDLAHLFY